MKKIFAFLLLGVAVSFMSCEKKLSSEEQFAKDIELIKEYIVEHNLEAEETFSGLHYVIEDIGTGNHPAPTDKVLVRYKGYKLDGSVFDESGPDGISFNLQQVIKGWTEGIPKLKEGGKGILLIPSKLAYGDKGSGPIKPNTVLAFDVALLTIVD